MGVVISESSELGRELWKWNHTTREIHPADEDKPSHEQLRGVRPATPLEFPKMLFKAQKKHNGKVSVGNVAPNPLAYENSALFERDSLSVEAFNRSCQRIVRDTDEQRKAERDGWCDSQERALEKFEAYEQDMAQAAAEANFNVRRMGQKAQEEFEAAHTETAAHVTDVTPKRKGDRG